MNRNENAVVQGKHHMIAAITQSKIIALAQAHRAMRIDWPGRGEAPPGYMPGIACAYAQVYAAWKRGDEFALEMARANTHDAERDALSWYAGEFTSFHMDNGANGANTLRHLAVLAAALGTNESSGGRDIGHDTTAGHETSKMAEAGIFQMSMNCFDATPLLPDLYAAWLSNHDDSLYDVFYKDIRHTAANLLNIGDGPGRDFQDNLKKFPALAFWLIMLALRYVRSAWGPINRREVTLEPAVDDLLKQVQAIVDAEGAIA